MTKKSRRREQDSQAWHDRHAAERAAAAVVVKRRQLPRDDGLRVVRIVSIADHLDEADPRVRGATFARPREVVAPFVPPRFQPTLVREKSNVTQPYISPNRIVLKRFETTDPKTGKKSGRFAVRGLKLPPDVARRLVDRIDGLTLEVELNDDGILFRPATAQPANISLPAWVPLKK